MNCDPAQHNAGNKMVIDSGLVLFYGFIHPKYKTYFLIYLMWYEAMEIVSIFLKTVLQLLIQF